MGSLALRAGSSRWLAGAAVLLSASAAAAEGSVSGPVSSVPGSGPALPETAIGAVVRAPVLLRPEPRREELPRDFVLHASPWVDFSLTNFWLEDRASNFLDVGVQVGGYFLERLRLSATLIAPLEEPTDEYYSGSYSLDLPQSIRSPSLSVLYGASFGLILANSKSFLFAPGIIILRADVNDYGTSAALLMPFDWTTSRDLRIGFDIAMGRSFGGTAHGGSADGASIERERPSGTALLFQFRMGWSLGRL